MFINKGNTSRNRFDDKFDTYPIQNHLFYDNEDDGGIHFQPNTKPTKATIIIPYLVISLLALALIMVLLKLFTTLRSKRKIAKQKEIVNQSESIKLSPVPSYSETKVSTSNT